MPKKMKRAQQDALLASPVNSEQTLKEFLEESEHFLARDVHAMREIVSVFTLKEVLQGETIVKQGDRNAILFVVLDGSLAVEKVNGETGPRTVQYRLSKGELYGMFWGFLEHYEWEANISVTSVTANILTISFADYQQIQKKPFMVHFQKSIRAEENALKKRTLKSLSFLKDVSDETLAKIAPKVKIAAYEAGTIISHAGDSYDAFFVLINGEVAIVGWEEGPNAKIELERSSKNNIQGKESFNSFQSFSTEIQHKIDSRRTIGFLTSGTKSKNRLAMKEHIAELFQKGIIDTPIDVRDLMTHETVGLFDYPSEDRVAELTHVTLSHSILLKMEVKTLGDISSLIPQVQKRIQGLHETYLVAKYVAEHTELFANMPKRLYHLLPKMMQKVVFPPGKIIKEEGNGDNSNFYVITRGSVNVFRKGTKIRRLGQYDYFGDLSYTEGSANTATVKVDSDDEAGCTCLCLPSDAFKNTGPRTQLPEFKLKKKGFDCSLDDILAHSRAKSVFLEYAKTSNVQEAIQFVEAVLKIKQIDRRECRRNVALAVGLDMNMLTNRKMALLKQSALSVHEEFIKTDRLNIQKSTKKEIGDRIEQEVFDYRMFDKARAEILDTLERDVFLRFKEGDKFKEFMEEIGVYYVS